MAGNTFKAFSKREERNHTTSTDSREKFLAWQEEKKAIERLRLVLTDNGLNGFIEDDLIKILSFTEEGINLW